jgi:hypothetical protein
MDDRRQMLPEADTAQHSWARRIGGTQWVGEGWFGWWVVDTCRVRVQVQALDESEAHEAGTVGGSHLCHSVIIGLLISL